MAIIEVSDIGVKKGNQIYSMKGMMVKAQGALKPFVDGCGIKKGNNIYVLKGEVSIGNISYVCQQQLVSS